MIRRLALLLALAALVLAVHQREALRMAWREPVELGWSDPQVPPAAELDAWLAAREAAVPALRPDAAKQIVWAGEPGARTPFSLVYVHGFSAAPPELRPVPDLVAAGLGANLHFTRLSGHGRDSAAMAGPKVADWAHDLAEAIAIGRELGDRVIVMGSSMGGTLATLAALDPDYGRDVAGLALVSPAYRLPGLGGKVITKPFVRLWGPPLFGGTRTSQPRSPRHAEAWTLTYPTVSVLPLGALVREIGGADKAEAVIPAIFFFSEADQVVDPSAVRQAAADWGAAAELVPLVMGPGDDPAAHVIAGDILSPGQSESMAERVIAWAKGL
ncbi:carboxylesterase [Poseidonocella sp. HB161398]|uniref:alpha/beta hydrolase n=1 Tax=Poseidonocella sp. HB161398 TaxID=2320855 RepID=UPI001109761C|nr:alpha/beta fold hydrolase [Poseidonocella sp. HB161398]